MKTMWKIRWIFVLSVGILLGIWFSYSQNVNKMSIVQSGYLSGLWSNASMSWVWRYFCPIDISVLAVYGGWSGFSNCQYAINFRKGATQLSYLGKWVAFNWHDTDILTWDGSLFFVEEKNTAPITSTVECSSFRVTWIDTSEPILSLNLTSPIYPDWNFDFLQNNIFVDTTDLLNLSFDGTDTLTWIQGLKINLYACPCDLDNQWPIITDWKVNDEDFVVGEHYQWNSRVKFLVYDKGWSSRSYWMHEGVYTGWAPAWMDNQEWVNSDTIIVKIYSWTQVIREMRSDNPELNIQAYDWSNNIPELTWDGNIRWYWVSFDTDFSVETPVKIEVSAEDNTLQGNWPKIKKKHVGTGNITFNQREKPILKFDSPVWQNINPNVWVQLTVSDKWAWINTGSLVVEILPVMSWGQVIMTWSIYSWSDLHFQLIDGTEELWWASRYKVTFQPRYEFAVNSTIRLSGYVEDLVWMEVQKTHTFSTRADCTFYGCVNFVDIFFWDIWNWNLVLNWFTWSLIVITWTIADYPYLTWSSWEIVMCGPISDSINLTWNVDIYSGNEIINWNEYPYVDLYVTGLDFEYESGVIVPNY